MSVKTFLQAINHLDSLIIREGNDGDYELHQKLTLVVLKYDPICLYDASEIMKIAISEIIDGGREDSEDIYALKRVKTLLEASSIMGEKISPQGLMLRRIGSRIEHSA